VYPCAVSIMCIAGCLLRSAGGRRHVTSISALLRVCLQVPESIALPRNSAWKSRDPTWMFDIVPATQVIAPSSSSIGISISVPSSSDISLNPLSSSYPYSYSVAIWPRGSNFPECLLSGYLGRPSGVLAETPTTGYSIQPCCPRQTYPTPYTAYTRRPRRRP